MCTSESSLGAEQYKISMFTHVSDLVEHVKPSADSRLKTYKKFPDRTAKLAQTAQVDEKACIAQMSNYAPTPAEREKDAHRSRLLPVSNVLFALPKHEMSFSCSTRAVLTANLLSILSRPCKLEVDASTTRKECRAKKATYG